MFKNYTTNQVVLPLDFSFQLEKNDIAFAINQLVESIPEERFLPFHHQMGPSSYHPKMMMKMILCAYTQSVFSGRKIEALTKDSIRMMWLTQSYQPSYRTINRFRVNPLVNTLLRECFVQFRSQLVKEQLIDEEAIFIDGTKIEANANKYTFVWRKSIDNFDKKLTEKSNFLYDELLKNQIIPEIERESAKELSVTELGKIEENLAHVVEKFTDKIEQAEDGITRKSIRSKRKVPKKLRKLFKDFKERKLAYQKHRQILGQRNSYSRTDPEATFMRMKDDHMKNGQLKAGYNLQIATNSQYILGYDLFSNPTDTRTFRPFLTTLKERFFDLPNYIVADAGYGGEENYQAVLEDHERTPLITYAMYHKEQKRKFKQNPFLPANWPYQEVEDTFLCPNGRKMTFRNYSIRTDKYGFKRYLKRYECEDCSNCPLRRQCTKAKSDKNREIQKNMNWEYFKATVQQLLSEVETGKIYRQRKIDVEPAFGHLKACLGFTRFSVRGKQQTHNEIGFALMAVNLRKYRLTKLINKDDSLHNLKNRRPKIIFYDFRSSILRFLGLTSQALFLFFGGDGVKKIGIALFVFFLPIILLIVMIAGVPEDGTTTDFSPQTDQEKVAYQVYQFVQKNGGTKEFACAWLGNMEHESGLRPNRIQSDLPFQDVVAFNPSIGGYAMGLAQWDSGRRVNLLNYAKEKKKQWQDIDLQLDFAWNHDSSDSALLKKFSKGTDINQITIDILIYWERAGTKDDPMQQAQRKTSANNWYNRLSKGSQGGGSANVGGGKIDVLETQMGQQVYNGECYGLTSFYVDSFNTSIHLGAWSPHGIAGNIGNTVSAAEIGNAYTWESNGWTVIHNPSYSDIKAGDIINWGQGGGATSIYGHTGIIASVSGDNKFTTYEQNSGQGRICAKYDLTWGVNFPNVTSIVRKK